MIIISSGSGSGGSSSSSSSSSSSRPAPPPRSRRPPDAIPYHTALCYPMLCHTIPYHTILHYTTIYYTLLCNAILQHHTVQLLLFRAIHLLLRALFFETRCRYSAARVAPANTTVTHDNGSQTTLTTDRETLYYRCL